jgi:hypothetical protein
MATAKKIVLVSKTGYDASNNELLRGLIARRIGLFCAVGHECERWEEMMDELVVGPTGECVWHVTTTSHPGETTSEVIEFARAFRLDEPGDVEVIEV